MDIKYELGILRRHLQEDITNHAKLMEQQNQKLNQLKGEHIQELQGIKGEGINRDEIIKLQALEVNTMKGNHVLALQQLSARIKQSTKKVDDFCKMVEHYSHFDSKEIGEVLAEILSALKGEEYIYQTTSRYTSKAGGDSKRIPLVIPYRIIIEKRLAHDSYLDDNISLDGLIKSNMALTLGDGSEERQICFYSASEEEHNLIPLIELKTVPFLKGRLLIVDGYAIITEFIDMLIEYKITNKLERIPLDKMTELKKGFIKSKQGKDEKGPLILS